MHIIDCISKERSLSVSTAAAAAAAQHRSVCICALHMASAIRRMCETVNSKRGYESGDTLHKDDVLNWLSYLYSLTHL